MFRNTSRVIAHLYNIVVEVGPKSRVVFVKVPSKVWMPVKDDHNSKQVLYYPAVFDLVRSNI